MPIPQLNLGFDAKRLYCNFTGLGNYSRVLVKNLQEHFPENSYNLYTPKIKSAPETDFFSSSPAFRTFEAKSLLKPFWRSYSIVQQLKKDKIDLYHGLSNEIPFNIKKSGIKSIVTIHDLIFKILPETYPLVDRVIYDVKFRTSCANADRIIAISQSTKNDIVRLYGVDPDKIEVVYQACNPIFYEPALAEDEKPILTKYNIPSEYLLFVGSVERRKNLLGLIESYKFLRPEFQLPIVVVGRQKKNSYNKTLQNTIEANGLSNKILWISDLNNNEGLSHLYRNAMALVYPSFYEGFGLPVAEALLSRTPVITSNVSSLPEAAGPQSFLIDPKKPEEIAHAVREVLANTKLRKTMIDGGYNYAMQRFAPKAVTEQLVDCYQRTLSR